VISHNLTRALLETKINR